MESRLSWQQVIKQIAYSCAAFLIVIQAGINISFSSILTPQLKTQHNLSINNESWIASLVALFVPIGCLSTGFTIDKYGRKTVTQFLTVPFFITWILIAMSGGNYTVIFIARAIGGFASGMTTVAIVYVSEISHANYRSFLLGFNSVFYSMGILLVYTIGFAVSWVTTSLIFAVLCILTCILLTPIPESPYWYKFFYDGVDKEEWVRNSYNTLYGKYNDQVYEIEMTNLLEKEQLPKVKTKIPWTHKTIYKPVIILVIIFLLQQLSGVYLIIFYVINILEQMHVLTVAKNTNDLQESNQYILSFGILRFISSVISAIVCRYYGRKPILIISCTGMAVSLLAALYFIQVGPNSEMIYLSVSGFLAFSSFGIVGIPWTLASELLSTEVRGKLCGYLFSAAYLFMFGTVKIFPFILHHVNIIWILVFFITVAIIKAAFVFIYVPETFKKNIDDILNYFN